MKGKRILLGILFLITGLGLVSLGSKLKDYINERRIQREDARVWQETSSLNSATAYRAGDANCLGEPDEVRVLFIRTRC